MADEPTTDSLTAAQWRAIFCLLSEPSVRQAAEKADVKERTLYRWLKAPIFADAYRDARREATQQAVARLQQASSAAAERLVKLLTSGKPAIELAAARTILEFAIKSVELDDLAARLAALEERYAAKL